MRLGVRAALFRVLRVAASVCVRTRVPPPPHAACPALAQVTYSDDQHHSLKSRTHLPCEGAGCTPATGAASCGRFYVAWRVSTMWSLTGAWAGRSLCSVACACLSAVQTKRTLLRVARALLTLAPRACPCRLDLNVPHSFLVRRLGGASGATPSGLLVCVCTHPPW